MELEKQWENIAKEYKKTMQTTDQKLGYDIILNLVKDNIKGSVILDYGCGSGKFSEQLIKLNPNKIIAVDTSKEAIKLAKENPGAKKINYRHIQSGDIKFIDNNSIDIAHINFVLCSIQNKEEIKKILKEINKKLNDNGKLIILDPNPKSPGYKYAKIEREKPQKLISGMPLKVNLDGLIFYDYWKSKEDYISFLKEAGFSIEEIIEPTIKEDTNNLWKDETKQAPTIIIISKKWTQIKK